MFDDEEILNEFTVESAEHLAHVENQLLAIEAAGADADPELVNTVFRGVHSIKGAAGFLGLPIINQLAHHLENVLNLLREQKLTPTSGIVDVLLRAADTLRNLTQNLATSNEADISQHVTELEAITEQDGSQKPPQGRPTKADNAADGAATVDPPPSAMSPLQGLAADEKPVSDPNIGVNSTGPSTSNATTSPVAKVSVGGESSIRVPVETIDQLMNLAGELVLSRNRLRTTISCTDQSELDVIASRINQVTSELQDAIMKTRMQPIGNVFNRFSRVVRDVSNKLRKQCRLLIEGDDVEVDKTIVEAIGDPLNHLVRNAIDHGLEEPHQRMMSGKSPEGTVSLRAFHQSGKVCVTVSDDGGGIDPDRLRQKAIDKGLMTPEAARELNNHEATRLIFHPGFSTAAELSDISGRGVGMDVVRTNIEKLGGLVEVESELHVGTTISITLPLTLAIIRSLIVRCAGEHFAIPQVNVSESVHVRFDEMTARIGRVRGAEVLKLRDRLLPLVRLSQALNLIDSTERPRASDSATLPDRVADDRHRDLNIIVIDIGQQTYGLVVDELLDSEEIVVKPLGRHLTNCRCFSGATILGDGRVALILDGNGIAAHSELRGLADCDAADQTQAAEVSPDAELHSMLVFTNHPDEQFAVSLDLISRIEPIRAEQIDSVGGLELLQYRGNSIPLFSLENHTTARPRKPSERLFVIVFDIAGKNVGLLAPAIHDIVSVAVEVDTVALREPGIPGSLLVKGKVTRLVDLFELVHEVHAEWFEHLSAIREEHTETRTILLAEDSDFFRKQVKKYFLDAGYSIVEAVDGLQAWNVLLSGEHVDGIVTDVQMPNMNGFELCQRIKTDERFSHLPVIVLTSLAGEDDIRKGRACHADDYQIKMDGEQLLHSANRLMRTLGGCPGRTPGSRDDRPKTTLTSITTA